MTAILEVENVSKLYGQMLAVDDVSFNINKGEVLTLLGRSGCGKSTTLRLVAGLERPDEGEIRLRGKVVVSTAQGIFVPPERRSVGLVFQSYAVWPHMTVFENIAYPLKIRRIAAAKIRAQVERIADLVGLSEYLSRPSQNLSGGQQQRVALGRALIHEPDLLLLDEPFSNLDTELREDLRLQMKDLQKRLNTSVLYVTHDQEEAMDLSHRVAVMFRGKIQQLAAPEVVYEQPENFFIQRFVGKILRFNGRLTGISGETATVRIGDAADLTAASFDQGLTVGDDVVVTVRPEDVAIVAGPEPGGCALPSTVLEKSFFGSRYELHIDTLGSVNTLPMDKTSRYDTGEQLYLSIPGGRARAWPVPPDS